MKSRHPLGGVSMLFFVAGSCGLILLFLVLFLSSSLPFLRASLILPLCLWDFTRQLRTDEPQKVKVRQKPDQCKGWEWEEPGSDCLMGAGSLLEVMEMF